MVSLYSLSLLTAMIFGTLGVLIAALTMLKVPLHPRIASRTRVITIVCLPAALAPALLSLIVHFNYGHGPTAVEPMSLLRFVTHHKAYWIVMILCLLMALSLTFQPDGSRTRD